MQTLFDLPMSSSLSYLVAVIVILGLLAIFAVIVRRVAGQGLRTEGARGRGPRLGVVDTYSLDRTRQLVIIRRDDVEHLLMIGGTNDVLIESNIVRALPASAIRDQQSSLLAQANLTPLGGYDDAPASQPNFDERAFLMQPPAPVQTQQQMPRLKPNPAPATRPVVEPEQAYAPPSVQPQNFDPYETPAQSQQLSRDALSNTELQALAKRLEASIPPLPPKSEKPVAQQQVTLAPEPKPAPQMTAPQNPAVPTPPTPPSAPQQIQQPASQPQPQAATQMPAPPAAIQVSSPMMQPPVQPPVMPQPRVTMAPPSVQIPVPPAAPAPIAPKPIMPQPAPQQVIQPMPQPVAPQQVAQPQPEPPKDKQAAALDENLRRLLGRKLDPR